MFYLHRLSDQVGGLNVFFYVTGLLQPGVTIAQANAALAVASPEYLRE